ncbi:MAG: pentapeptide repeat-containing protein [Candidatus Acidiferrales bacterium]
MSLLLRLFTREEAARPSVLVAVSELPAESAVTEAGETAEVEAAQIASAIAEMAAEGGAVGTPAADIASAIHRAALALPANENDEPSEWEKAATATLDDGASKPGTPGAERLPAVAAASVVPAAANIAASELPATNPIAEIAATNPTANSREANLGSPDVPIISQQANAASHDFQETSTDVRASSLDADAIANAEPPGTDAISNDGSHAAAASLEATPYSGPRIEASEWALEEALANHKEWLDTKGVYGRKADLHKMELEGVELIGATLRYADLEDANLRATDLLLADLRDACLVRANFEDACLVGANLEGANLEGATLDAAMGLVPRQLAGANLRAASVPASVEEFPAQKEFSSASQMAARYFVAVSSFCAVAWLLIWRTKDAQLLTDSAVLPYVHATTALPTAEFYLIAPVALFILYMVFHYHLQRTWEAVLELPAIFPDGRVLGANGPRVVMGLARGHFRWLTPEAGTSHFIEKWAMQLLAYWMAPATLLLFWGRYLTLQEIHGTLLQELLIVGSAGVAIYSVTRIGRVQERWALGGRSDGKILARLRKSSVTSLVIALGVILTFLSVGTIAGVPHDRTRAPQYGPMNIRRWAPNVLWLAGLDPYADLTEASISSRPPNWTGADEQVASVRGAHLNEAKFRWAQAYGAFFANSHLWRADFEGAFLAQADLRNSDLGQADFRLAVLDRAQLRHANLDRARMDGAILSRTDMREANLSYSSLVGAALVDARLDGASLYGSNLASAIMIRANLERADLRDVHLESADLEHADLQQAYLWSSKLNAANLQGAQLSTAIFIQADLQGANLEGAHLQGTVLNDANLQDAILDNADLRGALGLSASQVCSTKSRRGALLDDAVFQLVAAQCGAGGAISEPIATSQPSAAPATMPTPAPMPAKAAVR